MSKSKDYAEVYRALRPVTLFVFVLCPIIYCMIIGLGFFCTSVIIIPIAALIIKARKDKKRKGTEINEALIRQALMTYLNKLSDRDKQEFLNYLAQCPEAKKQEILLKILQEYIER